MTAPTNDELLPCPGNGGLLKWKHPPDHKAASEYSRLSLSTITGRLFGRAILNIACCYLDLEARLSHPLREAILDTDLREMFVAGFVRGHAHHYYKPGEAEIDAAWHNHRRAMWDASRRE